MYCYFNFNFLIMKNRTENQQFLLDQSASRWDQLSKIPNFEDNPDITNDLKLLLNLQKLAKDELNQAQENKAFKGKNLQYVDPKKKFQERELNKNISNAAESILSWNQGRG